MRYAKIKDGAVSNLINLRQSQESEFPDCVPALDELPVQIGDAYEDGKFFRDGRQVKSDLEKATEQLHTTSAAALTAAQDTCKRLDEPPAGNVGTFISGAAPWEAEREYERFDLFSYNGAVGWVKQAHTSQAHWLPFSTGTEALYGARPAPDEDGVYPYVYNMAAFVGMRVRENGVIYVCYNPIDDLLWPPSQVAAHFRQE